MRTRSTELKSVSGLDGKGVEAWLKNVKLDDVVLMSDVYVSPDFDDVNDRASMRKQVFEREGQSGGAPQRRGLGSASLGAPPNPWVCD